VTTRNKNLLIKNTHKDPAAKKIIGKAENYQTYSKASKNTFKGISSCSVLA
jgi:hypothetical protein